MENNSNQLNSNNYYDITEYNHSSCARIGCKNNASYCLRLVLIKRSGWFYERCMQELQEDGLVEYIIDEHLEGKKGGINFGKY